MEEERSLNFIEQIVEKDLQEGVNDGRIQTRRNLTDTFI